MKLKSSFLASAILIISYSSTYCQENLSTGSRVLSNINYSVTDVIGDNFLGSQVSSTLIIEHSILGGSGGLVLGLSESNPIELNVFPNPFHSNVQIRFKEDSNYEISITNSIGLEIKRVSVYSSTSIDLTELPKGVYIVKVLDTKRDLINVYEIIKI